MSGCGVPVWRQGLQENMHKMCEMCGLANEMPQTTRRILINRKAKIADSPADSPVNATAERRRHGHPPPSRPRDLRIFVVWFYTQCK